MSVPPSNALDETNRLLVGIQLVIVGGFVYLSDLVWASPGWVLLLGPLLMLVGLGLGLLTYLR